MSLIQYNKADIRRIIEEYHWKQRLIQSQVYETDSTAIGSYGVESAMPKGKGETSDRVASTVMRNDKEYRKNDKIIKELQFVDQYESYITSDKNFHILQLIKQGESKRRIKVLLNISSGQLYKCIDKVVEVMHDASTK